MGGGLSVFAIFELLALSRYSGDMAWSAPGAWLYVLFLLSRVREPLRGVVVPIRRPRDKVYPFTCTYTYLWP